MLIHDKKTFGLGLILFITFLIVLGIMFSPFFGGENALKASDKLFNSIAKGSTYYIPDLLKKAQAMGDARFEVAIKLKSDELAQKAQKILTTAGNQVSAAGSQMNVKGNLGDALTAALKDSDSMFHNRDSEVAQKYGFSGKEALFVWWNVLKEVEKDLTRQAKFRQAAFVSTVIKKGVEVGYNFFGIAPESALSKAGILTFALVFYVVYTLWWGIAILFLFEGLGLEMKAGAKKEV
ncbi:MAG: hypothetical protein ACP5M0_11750 [Desulfomonilaceae bacterium]